MAWEAWAWRNQCGEIHEATTWSMPALAGTRLTMVCAREPSWVRRGGATVPEVQEMLGHGTIAPTARAARQ
jgi:hypothetical protein